MERIGHRAFAESADFAEGKLRVVRASLQKMNLSIKHTTYPDENALVTRYTVTNAMDLLLRSRSNVSY